MNSIILVTLVQTVSLSSRTSVKYSKDYSPNIVSQSEENTTPIYQVLSDENNDYEGPVDSSLSQRQIDSSPQQSATEKRMTIHYNITPKYFDGEIKPKIKRSKKKFDANIMISIEIIFYVFSI